MKIKDIYENTAGAIASVAMPFGSILRRQPTFKSSVSKRKSLKKKPKTPKI